MYCALFCSVVYTSQWRQYGGEYLDVAEDELLANRQASLPDGQMARWSGCQVAKTIVEFVHHHIFVGRARLLVEGVDLQGHRELLHVEGVGVHLGRGGGQEKEWE